MPAPHSHCTYGKEPLKDFGILVHSMGGLVSRSAYHYGRAAGQTWPQQLHKLVFLGTPHHGALLEQGGNWVNVCLGLSPYTAHSLVWVNSGAQASPTYAMAICSTKIGKGVTASSMREISGIRCP